MGHASHFGSRMSDPLTIAALNVVYVWTVREHYERSCQVWDVPCRGAFVIVSPQLIYGRWQLLEELTECAEQIDLFQQALNILFRAEEVF